MLILYLMCNNKGGNWTFVCLKRDLWTNPDLKKHLTVSRATIDLGRWLLVTKVHHLPANRGKINRALLNEPTFYFCRCCVWNVRENFRHYIGFIFFLDIVYSFSNEGKNEPQVENMCANKQHLSYLSSHFQSWFSLRPRSELVFWGLGHSRRSLSPRLDHLKCCSSLFLSSSI